MDHTDFPIARPIPLEVFKTFEDAVDWNEVYGRYGTEKLVYSDFYNGTVPAHLVGKVSHVWMYFER